MKTLFWTREQMRPVHEVAARRLWSSDVLGRDIILNPCFGGYENPSHWFISIQGSPPRGCLVVDIHYDIPQCVFLILAEKSRRVGDQQGKKIKAFLRQAVEESGQRAWDGTDAQSIKIVCVPPENANRPGKCPAG